MTCALYRGARRCRRIACATAFRLWPNSALWPGIRTGHWPVRVGGKWALLLGPVAVHPTHQGEGLGGLLIYRAIEIARIDKWSRILLVGDAPYYGRFGFVRLEGVVMPPPTNPDRVLGLELREGAWVAIAGPVTRPVD